MWQGCPRVLVRVPMHVDCVCDKNHGSDAFRLTTGKGAGDDECENRNGDGVAALRGLCGDLAMVITLYTVDGCDCMAQSHPRQCFPSFVTSTLTHTQHAFALGLCPCDKHPTRTHLQRANNPKQVARGGSQRACIARTQMLVAGSTAQGHLERSTHSWITPHHASTSSPSTFAPLFVCQAQARTGQKINVENDGNKKVTISCALAQNLPKPKNQEAVRARSCYNRNSSIEKHGHCGFVQPSFTSKYSSTSLYDRKRDIYTMKSDRFTLIRQQSRCSTTTTTTINTTDHLHHPTERSNIN